MAGNNPGSSQEHLSKIYLVNGRSISPSAAGNTRWKLPFIRETLLEEESSLPVLALAITETWLKPYISDAQIKLEDYSVFRSDRPDRVGGGCVLYVKDDIPISYAHSFSDRECSLVVAFSAAKNILFSCVYRPPDCTEKSFCSILDILRKQISSLSSSGVPEIFIMGDLNLPLFNWDVCSIPSTPPSSAYSLMLNFIGEHFLTQVVDKPTRLSNTLDIILTNTPQWVAAIQTEDSHISDHKIVDCLLTVNPTSCSLPTTRHWDHQSFRGINIHKGDYEAISAELMEVNWDELHQLCVDLDDENGELFKELIVFTVLQISLKHCPKKRPRPRNPKGPLDQLKRRRRKVRTRIAALKASGDINWKLKELMDEEETLSRAIQQKLVEALEEQEERAVETIKSNPRYFFSYAKQLSKTKSELAPLKRDDGSLTTDNAEKAELLQSQYCSVFTEPDSGDAEKSVNWVREENNAVLEDFEFSPGDISKALAELDPYSSAPDGDIPARILHSCRAALSIPLHMLWDESLSNGITPPSLKLQYIAPIFKRGDKTLAANYRPVSLTSNLLKTFERIMRNKIVEHLETNELLPESQHGFRKQRGCLTQLLQHMDDVFKELNSGNEVDVIYLDYSKAFDKVNHAILLAKLEKIGIRGKVLDWIRDFLSGRFQTVIVEGEKSSFQPVKSGVPQGTVLGPILFIIYVADLERRIQHSKVGTFADDTKLKKPICSVNSALELQEDLNSVVEWSDSNSMALHEEKFEVLHYTLNRPQLLSALPFSYEFRDYTTPAGSTIHPSTSVRDLGILLSDDCSWTLHIARISLDARRMAGWVCRAFKSRSATTMMTLYKSLVRCKLEYCSPLWSPFKVGNIQTIEDVQRFFTRKVEGMEGLRYPERLKALRLQSLQRRRERYTIIQMWKIYNGASPNSTGIRFYLHQRLGIKAEVPSLYTGAQRSVSTKYFNSFGVRAARLWNTLPKNVNTAVTLESFKVVLGQWLDSFPDDPPVRGVRTVNGNSIMDWVLESRVKGGCS